jgi:CubicO group peptidase (beta-lactamase class C family)
MAFPTLLLLVLAQAGPARPADAASADAVVQKFLGQPGVVGLSVAVGRGKEVVLARGYGLAELEFSVPADAETMFRIGSVTKQFTAAAVLRLQEQEKLAIDEPLTTYLPDYPTHGAEITLRHLLTHTSGIPNYTNLGPEWERIVSRELSHEEMLALWKDLPLEFAPGERWNYSNSAYYLLGVVIERVAGQPYGDFLQAEFFEPLALERTRYDSNAEVIPNRAQGYGFGEGKPWNDRLIGMSQPGAAGALISSAQDLVRWEIALVSGQVVSPEFFEEMTLPYMLLDGKETSYGFGLALEPVAGQPCLSHGGGIFGFNSWLGYFPGAELTVAVISNSEGVSAQAIALELAKALLAGD